VIEVKHVNARRDNHPFRIAARRLTVLVWGVLVGLALLQSANAQPVATGTVATGHTDVRASSRAHHVTPGEAARRAQRINGGGRVLSVVHGQDGYRVKLIKHGEIRIVFVPGE